MRINREKLVCDRDARGKTEKILLNRSSENRTADKARAVLLDGKNKKKVEKIRL